jgi:CRP-like cAMP-binding protein
MFEIFERYLTERIVLTDGQLNLIRSLSVEKKIARREFILRKGETSRHTNFVSKGFLRLYRTDHKGDEYILRFADENHWINDRESYLTGQPSTANIEAIENSEILTWKKSDFDLLLNEIPVFKELMKNLSAKLQIASQNRFYTSVSSTAEEKYLQFVTRYPAIFNRIPLHMVASYIGVSRETLSRVRRASVSQ